MGTAFTENEKIIVMFSLTGRILYTFILLEKDRNFLDQGKLFGGNLNSWKRAQTA